jgi:YbbR domain-containing protein
MPFRENTQFNIARSPAELWLRRIFIEDWSLKLLALAITLVLWFVVSGREIEREITVEPSVEGKPAPTYEVKEVLVTPARVRVTGPASSVNSLEKAPTQTISIEGRRESFDAPRTAIQVADPKVAVHDTVNIHVTIVAVGDSKPGSRNTN